MSANRPPLVSGRVPVTDYGNLTADRYEFLGLNQAEPNLGPGAANSVLTLGNSNTRIWANSLTLQQVSVTGNVIGGGFLTIGLISATGNITGGNILSNGNASFSGSVTANTFIGNIQGNIDAAGANTQVQFNDVGDILGASAAFTFDKAANLLTVTGNVQAGNLRTAGQVSATGTATVGNVTTGGTVTATGNITGGNLVTAGLATVTGNVIAGNVSTAGVVTATGNITGGNINANNAISGNTLNINGNAIIGGDLVVNGNLTYINVTELNVEDPIIGLGRGANNAPLVIDDGKDRGEQLWYFSGTEKSAFTGYQNSSGKILLATNVSISNEIVTVNSFGTVSIGNLEGASISVTGNTTSGNVLSGGVVSATGNITGGNLRTAGNVSVTGNVTAVSFVGNVSATTVSASGNIDGGNLRTAGLITATGNVTGGNLVTAGVISATGNILSNGNASFSGSVTANTFIGNIQGNIDAAGANTQIQFNDTGDILGASAAFTFDKAANLLTVTGNVQAGNLRTTGQVSATGTATVGNVVTGGQVTATGDVTGANINTAGVVTATGNIDGGNLRTAGDVSATGSVTATSFVGNVSAVTVSASGNIDSGNLRTAGLISATGTATVGNINTAGLITATGNVTGGNVLTGGLISATGKLDVGGQITSTGVGNTDTNGGQIFLNGATLNRIDWNTNGTGAPEYTTRSAGAKVVLYPSIGGSATDYALGVEAGALWSGIPGNDAGQFFKWYGGNVPIASLSGTGVFSATGNVVGGNINTAGIVSATGNVVGGNINTAGLISATGNVIAGNVNAVNFDGSAVSVTGNVQAGNLRTVGVISSSGTATVGSVATAGTVSATGNVTGGNINTANTVTAGTVTATGNVQAGNILTTGLISATGTINSASNIAGANLTTAGLITAVGNVIAGAIQSSIISTVSGNLDLIPAPGNNSILLTPTGTGNVFLFNKNIRGLASPLDLTDAATKDYVDNAVSTGLQIHAPVNYATTGTLTATYTQGGTTPVLDQISGNVLTFTAAHGLSLNNLIYWGNTFNGITANVGYFVQGTPSNTQITISETYSGIQYTGLTNGGPGLAQTARANPGVGATLVNAGANAALQIDSVTVSVNNRILVKNQTTGFENGVYTVNVVGNATTAWQMTRSTDEDSYIPNSVFGIDAGDYFFVQAGNINIASSFVLSAPTGEIIIGFDAITFSLFSQSIAYNAGNGLSLVGATFNVNVDPNTLEIDVFNRVAIKASANLVTPNIGAATGTSVSLTGNVTGGNVLTSGLISATGNVSANNVNTGNASVTGNIIVGNSIQLANNNGGTTQVFRMEYNAANAAVDFIFV
jgi:hypothetical protein